MSGPVVATATAMPVRAAISSTAGRGHLLQRADVGRPGADAVGHQPGQLAVQVHVAAVVHGPAQERRGAGSRRSPGQPVAPVEEVPGQDRADHRHRRERAPLAPGTASVDDFPRAAGRPRTDPRSRRGRAYWTVGRSSAYALLGAFFPPFFLLGFWESLPVRPRGDLARGRACSGAARR